MSRLIDLLRSNILTLVEHKYLDHKEEVVEHFDFLRTVNDSNVCINYIQSNCNAKVTLPYFKYNDEDIIENEIEVAQYALNACELKFTVSEMDINESESIKLKIALYNKQIELLERRIVRSENELKMKIVINEIIEYVEGLTYAIN